MTPNIIRVTYMSVLKWCWLLVNRNPFIRYLRRNCAVLSRQWSRIYRVFGNSRMATGWLRLTNHTLIVDSNPVYCLSTFNQVNFFWVEKNSMVFWGCSEWYIFHYTTNSVWVVAAVYFQFGFYGFLIYFISQVS